MPSRRQLNVKLPDDLIQAVRLAATGTITDFVEEALRAYLDSDRTDRLELLEHRVEQLESAASLNF